MVPIHSLQTSGALAVSTLDLEVSSKTCELLFAIKLEGLSVEELYGEIKKTRDWPIVAATFDFGIAEDFVVVSLPENKLNSLSNYPYHYSIYQCNSLILQGQLLQSKTTRIGGIEIPMVNFCE